jgi:hypothetical protein
MLGRIDRPPLPEESPADARRVAVAEAERQERDQARKHHRDLSGSQGLTAWGQKLVRHNCHQLFLRFDYCIQSLVTTSSSFKAGN